MTPRDAFEIGLRIVAIVFAALASVDLAAIPFMAIGVYAKPGASLAHVLVASLCYLLPAAILFPSATVIARLTYRR